MIAMAVTPDNELVVLDSGSNRIRTVSRGGAVSSLAGCEKAGYIDGPAAAAHFRMLSGVAVGEDGSLALRHRAANNQVVTVAGGSDEGTESGRGIEARFMEPTALVIKGRTLYMLDRKASAIRKVQL